MALWYSKYPAHALPPRHSLWAFAQDGAGSIRSPPHRMWVLAQQGCSAELLDALQAHYLGGIESAIGLISLCSKQPDVLPSLLPDALPGLLRGTIENIYRSRLNVAHMLDLCLVALRNNHAGVIGILLRATLVRATPATSPATSPATLPTTGPARDDLCDESAEHVVGDLVGNLTGNLTGNLVGNLVEKVQSYLASKRAFVSDDTSARLLDLSTKLVSDEMVPKLDPNIGFRFSVNWNGHVRRTGTFTLLSYAVTFGCGFSVLRALIEAGASLDGEISVKFGQPTFEHKAFDWCTMPRQHIANNALGVAVTLSNLAAVRALLAAKARTDVFLLGYRHHGILLHSIHGGLF